MVRRVRRLVPLFPLIALVVSASLSGCFLVAAGAGAAGAIAYTQRGASSNIPGSVDATFDKATRAFTALNITETGRSTADSGATRRLVGKQGETEITVEMKRSSAEVTALDVVARKNTVEYDKELATTVLNRIVQ